MPSTHISIRITKQRRANLDGLAARVHSDRDTATIDFALGFALAHLATSSRRPLSPHLTRLYLCDCAERVLHLYEKAHRGDLSIRKALEASRRYALGQATEDDMMNARHEAAAAGWDAMQGDAMWTAAYVAHAVRETTRSDDEIMKMHTLGWITKALIASGDQGLRLNQERQWQEQRLAHYYMVAVDESSAAA
jgi:hypothetical protein